MLMTVRNPHRDTVMCILIYYKLCHFVIPHKCIHEYLCCALPYDSI